MRRTKARSPVRRTKARSPKLDALIRKTEDEGEEPEARHFEQKDEDKDPEGGGTRSPEGGGKKSEARHFDQEDKRSSRGEPEDEDGTVEQDPKLNPKFEGRSPKAEVRTKNPKFGG